MDLAQRAVACKGWRWLPGMLDSDGWRYSGESEGAHWWWHPEEDQGELPLTQVRGTPDLTDPATLGCLLALVREAWGDPHVYAAPDGEDDLWVCHVRISASCSGIEAASEAEALVAALEAASCV